MMPRFHVNLPCRIMGTKYKKPLSGRFASVAKWLEQRRCCYRPLVESTTLGVACELFCKYQARAMNCKKSRVSDEKAPIDGDTSHANARKSGVDLAK
jgi:hypothetical protein